MTAFRPIREAAHSWSYDKKIARSCTVQTGFEPSNILSEHKALYLQGHISGVTYFQNHTLKFITF